MNSLRRPSLYAKKWYLLSHAEQRLFVALEPIVRPIGRLMAKVRLADVVSCESVSNLNGDFGRISQKHLDFVLIDPTTSKILIAIELDDRSHLSRLTQKRDVFVNDLLFTVGLPLVRIQAAAGYNPYVLRHQIRLAMLTINASDRTVMAAVLDVGGRVGRRRRGVGEELLPRVRGRPRVVGGGLGHPGLGPLACLTGIPADLSAGTEVFTSVPALFCAIQHTTAAERHNA